MVRYGLKGSNKHRILFWAQSSSFMSEQSSLIIVLVSVNIISPHQLRCGNLTILCSDPKILKPWFWKCGFQALVRITNLGSFLNCRSPDSILRASNSVIPEWDPRIFILTGTLGNSGTGGPWATYYGLGYKGNVKRSLYASPFQYGEKTGLFNAT